MCLSVRDHVSVTTRPIFTKFSVHVVYGRGSVLLLQRCNTLRIFSFLDDVILAHKLLANWLLDVDARLRYSKAHMQPSPPINSTH